MLRLAGVCGVLLVTPLSSMLVFGPWDYLFILCKDASRPNHCAQTEAAIGVLATS